MTKNPPFWPISGRKNLVFWYKCGTRWFLSPITMRCNVVRPPTISIPWHTFLKLCDDRVLPHLVIFGPIREVQPDFGPISVSNTKILLSPRSQQNLLSFAKKVIQKFISIKSYKEINFSAYANFTVFWSWQSGYLKSLWQNVLYLAFCFSQHQYTERAVSNSVFLQYQAVFYFSY